MRGVRLSNETVLIDQYLQSRQDARDTPLPGDVAFEFLAAQYELSDEEIELGRVGGGMDGGTDGFYTFLDGILMDEDSAVFAPEFKGRRAATCRDRRVDLASKARNLLHRNDIR
jgi:hypothetical protein